MTIHIVGVGDLAVSKTPGDVIKTFALGSCVGVVLVDPISLATGMLHLVLPEGAQHQLAQRTPAYFADTGIPVLVAAMATIAGRPNRSWICKLAGGANVLQRPSADILDIGQRNILAARKHLEPFGLNPLAEDVGQSHSRTISVAVGDPRLFIQNRQVGNITI